ncbi:MAG: 16S rRNA (uracil(1498)-N(3))-methyltransferase [Verrucomicrobia bacterium]|nr:16S rRNA (uracil(1498)-N(3))-methyltransferase [Verrucomicrobiota bacterium]
MDTEPNGDVIALSRAESHHLLKVRRANENDTIEVLRGDGHIWRGTLLAKTSGIATIGITEQIYLRRGATMSLHLALAIPKGKTMDSIIHRATELGLSSIRPLYTAHSEISLRGEKESSKLEKWRTIAIEAMKQCGNPWLPAILPPQNLSDYIRQQSSSSGQHLVAALIPEAKPLRATLEQLSDKENLILLVGPEGDFSPEEYKALMEMGALPFSLGKIILRVETAVISAIGYLNAHYTSLS